MGQPGPAPYHWGRSALTHAGRSGPRTMVSIQRLPPLWPNLLPSWAQSTQLPPHRLPFPPPSCLSPPSSSPCTGRGCFGRPTNICQHTWESSALPVNVNCCKLLSCCLQNTHSMGTSFHVCTYRQYMYNLGDIIALRDLTQEPVNECMEGGADTIPFPLHILSLHSVILHCIQC